MGVARAFGSDGRQLTLADRLEQCIAAAGGLTRAAHAMGMTPQGVRKIVRESASGARGGPLLPIVELARAAGVSTDWIATGYDRRPDLVSSLRGFSEEQAEFGTSGVSAPRADWIVALGLSAADVEIVAVNGDAMSPTLRDGVLVIIDRSVTSITSEGVYAILTSRGLAIRRAQVMLGGVVKLIADNATYAPETVSAQEVATLRVAGRVRAAIVTL